MSKASKTHDKEMMEKALSHYMELSTNGGSFNSYVTSSIRFYYKYRKVIREFIIAYEDE